MNNGKNIGMAIIVAGIIILIVYGLYEGFQEINLEEINVITAIGTGAIIIGLLILFISIIIEQQQGKQKIKKEIKKEDLEP